MLQHISAYHARVIGYYLNHYDFFTLASEAMKEVGHFYHVLHVIL